jgi:hypothetical protein
MASQIQPKNNEKKQTYCILLKKALEKKCFTIKSNNALGLNKKK